MHILLTRPLEDNREMILEFQSLSRSGWVVYRDHDYRSCGLHQTMLFVELYTTRLHPQGKGGPQAILWGQRLKRGKKIKTRLQSGSKNRQFSKDRPFTSRGLFD